MTTAECHSRSCEQRGLFVLTKLTVRKVGESDVYFITLYLYKVISDGSGWMDGWDW